MNSKRSLAPSSRKCGFIVFIVLALLVMMAIPVSASEDLYQRLSESSRSDEALLLNKLLNLGQELDWSQAITVEFEGNLRLLETDALTGEDHLSGLYLVRELDGTLHILSPPATAELQKTETATFYSGLNEILGDKLIFKAQIIQATSEGESYSFIRLLEKPQQLMLDRIFKISIMFMFFFVMLGMGLTLTVNDFMMVIKKPKGILVGISLQWLLMPILALSMAYLLGFYHAFPFIYAGLVLICACPGGVTSNLMTYYARGDLALSVSLTSISTVLALFFTPLILTLFSANIPDIEVPAGLIVQTITGLVLIPLILGMAIRHKWLGFAKKATPYFSALGVIALLMVISVGIITNAEKFADTERYSLLFYIMVVALSLLGMLLAAIFSKLFRIDNYQARAVSMEVGLRNSTLAVTIALLIQDLMGDFYSSMFVTTAIYGITMYITGFLMIVAYKKLLPLNEPELQSADAQNIAGS